MNEIEPKTKIQPNKQETNTEKSKVDDLKTEKSNHKKFIKFSFWKLFNFELHGYNKKDTASLITIVFIFFLLCIIISKFKF